MGTTFEGPVVADGADDVDAAAESVVVAEEDLSPFEQATAAAARTKRSVRTVTVVRRPGFALIDVLCIVVSFMVSASWIG